LVFFFIIIDGVVFDCVWCDRQDITIGEYQLDLIPLEDDVLTLALDSAYKECFLEVYRRPGDSDRFAIDNLSRTIAGRSNIIVLFGKIIDKTTINVWYIS
jgi:hypothetical protein